MLGAGPATGVCESIATRDVIPVHASTAILSFSLCTRCRYLDTALARLRPHSRWAIVFSLTVAGVTWRFFQLTYVYARTSLCAFTSANSHTYRHRSSTMLRALPVPTRGLRTSLRVLHLPPSSRPPASLAQ